MSRLAAFTTVLLASSTAHANPLESAWLFSSDDDAAQPAQPTEHPKPIREQKSEAAATALALAGTAAGAAMLLGGAETDNDALFLFGGAVLVLAPSAGHWYAGEPLTWGLPVRILGAGLAAVGSFQSLGCWSVTLGEDDCGGTELVVGGLVTLGAGALIDIATAGRAARKYNERYWTVTPTLVSDGQSKAMGFGISGSF